MNESNSQSNKSIVEKINRLLARMPSNIPFVPLVRRPDYQLRKIYFRYRKAHSATFLIVLMLASVFFIYIGGFYMLTHDNIAIYEDPVTGDSSVIWNDDGYGALSDQTLFEGFAAGISMFLGAGGVFMIHHASKYAYSPSTAAKLMLGGIALVTFAFTVVMLIFTYKIGVLQELLKKWVSN